MKPDETPQTPVDAPFEFGDRTLLALRAQPFAIEHEYGTMILPAGRETTEIPLPVVEIAALQAEIDPIVRLEQKLDAALRLIQSLQQQLDSIDATLARALNR
jgi:hypothetical protein